jgi:hypothetical protein
MKKIVWAVLGVLCAGISSAVAQVQTVERSAKGPANKDLQVGVYINVQPDCTSGTLPSIRLASPPANGKVTVKRGTVNATNYKQCLALQVPAFIAFYRSNSGFVGTDVLTLEVKFPGGRTEIQKVTVTIGNPSQNI